MLIYYKKKTTNLLVRDCQPAVVVDVARWRWGVDEAGGVQIPQDRILKRVEEVVHWVMVRSVDAHSTF